MQDNLEEVQIENLDFKTRLKNRIKKYVKEKPKESYFILVGITLLSLLFTIGNIIYTQRVVIPEYNKVSKTNIFKDSKNSFLAPIEATEKIVDLREVLQELEHYKSKTTLTTNDSLRVKYLIDKYRKNDKK